MEEQNVYGRIETFLPACHWPEGMTLMFSVQDSESKHRSVLVGTNRSYADVVRGTTGKSSNMTDAVRQPTVSGKW
jgi:hypothetical protein